MTEPDSIRPAVAAIEARIQLLQKELADLHVAMKVLTKLGEGREQMATIPVKPGVSAHGTLVGLHQYYGGGEAVEVIKDANSGRILRSFMGRSLDNINNRTLFSHILKESSSPWLTANEIQEAASKLKGMEVPMSTVSPTLSDMKKQGIVIRDGMRVILRERAMAIAADDPAFGRWLINLENTVAQGGGRYRIKAPLFSEAS